MTRPRPVGRGVLGVLAAVLAGLMAAGCASIPSSSRPQVISESVPAPVASEDTDPRYDAITPQPGEAPLDIVRDYLAVGGSFERKHARARAYLTPAADKDWDDEGGVVSLEDPTVDLEVRRGGAEVALKAQQRGTVGSDGSYLPSAVPFPYVFRLEKQNGEWRISNPPSGVLVRSSTFDSAYRPYNVYFLDSTRTRVVPDVRWLAAPTDALPSLLVGALEKGPSAALRGAVRSDLEGARLQSNVVQENDRVRVYLTGLGDHADAAPPGAFAQLVWTLNQLGVGGIEVYDDGQQVQPRGDRQQALQRLSDWRDFDPDAMSVSTPAYFVRNGAIWTTDNAPVPGPAGRGDYGAVSVGASPDERSLAVVGRGGGGRPALFVGGAHGALRPVLLANSLTAPSWGTASDEVWTVRDGRDVFLVPTRGGPTRVTMPALDQIGPIRALKLSRDGTRVAMVAGPAGRQRLQVGVVVRDNGAVRIDRVSALDVGEASVSDVSWSDALGLAVLVRAGLPDSALYSVSIDGVFPARLITSSGLPGPPAATAAAPGLPLLTTAAGSIWQTPAHDQPWTRVTRDPIPDSAPAYPG